MGPNGFGLRKICTEENAPRMERDNNKEVNNDNLSGNFENRSFPSKIKIKNKKHFIWTPNPNAMNGHNAGHDPPLSMGHVYTSVANTTSRRYDVTVRIMCVHSSHW